MPASYRRLNWAHHTADGCSWPWRFDPTCGRCKAHEAQPQWRPELRLLTYWIGLVGVVAVLTETVLGGLGPLLLVTLVFTWPLVLVAVGLWARRRRRVVVMPPDRSRREGLVHDTATHAPMGRP